MKNTISNILRNELKKIISESTMDRIVHWTENYEIAIVTAWRNQYKDVTDKTFKPEGKEIGDTFRTVEKKKYNREFKAKLLDLGYGVTNVRGSYREGGYEGTDEQEESFFIVNLKNDPNFKQTIFNLSEYYNQDSFLYSPMGSDEAILIGTNNCDFPGYGNEISAGSLQKNVQSMFMTRIGNKGFAFADKNDTYNDKPLTFNDRKQGRINESILKYLETFDRASIGAKFSIVKEAKKCKALLKEEMVTRQGKTEPYYDQMQNYDLSSWVKIGKIGEKEGVEKKYDFTLNKYVEAPFKREYYDYDIWANPNNPMEYGIMRGSSNGVGKVMTIGNLPQWERDNIVIFNEYRNTDFAVPFFGKQVSQDILKKHEEFMSKFNIQDGKVLLKHNSSVKINDGVLSCGHEKNSYSNNNDIGWYSWASKEVGADPSGNGMFTYYALVDINDVYDYQYDVERVGTLRQAVKTKPYVAMYWGDDTDVIAVTSLKTTPFEYVRNNRDGKFYDSEWNEITTQ